MTPAARLQAAIELLDELARTNAPADRFLRAWFRGRRYAGAKDRAAIAERVFDMFRHRASSAWRMQSEAPRALIIASVLAEGGDIEALFSGAGYGPPPLSDEERAAIAAPPQGTPPLHVRCEFPAFLEDELKRSLGDALEAEMHAMQARAPVDLRVNALKATRDEVLTLLRKESLDADPTPYAPYGIRLPAGRRDLRTIAAFERGLFEFQDEASQMAAVLVGAGPGERILDLAAGGGGKALAMAAEMQNEGEILAFDDVSERLKPLPERAVRAGASCITVADKRGGLLWGDGKFDAVLVDAPCSGTGTWRRQPELRWRITPESLSAVRRTQASLLDDAARHARGRITYVTCSLLRCENEDQIESFLERHPEYRLRPATEIWTAAGGKPFPAMGQFFKASPHKTATDAFFTAVLEQGPPQSDEN